MTSSFLCLYSLTFFLIFQAAEIPKPRDVESPKDSGVRKRKGGQANVTGQVRATSIGIYFHIHIEFQGGREYLTVASMDSALSHSLASEDSDNDLLE